MPTLQKINLLKFPLISAIFLCGCSANHYSIHQSELLNSDKSAVISVDAKQRFLLSNVITKTTAEIPAIEGKPAILAADGKPAIPATEGKPSQPKTTEKFRRYCTEPSPDVFTVLSQSASAGGSFGQTASPQSINIALQGAFSSSETGSTISRTQTINMLKEMMYRTCERYLNGQISDEEYPIIAARDQRIMTSILAIEQLTGAALAKPVVIAASGNASTGQTTSDAILSLDNASKKIAEKKYALETAQKAFVDIDKPKGSCKTLMSKDEKDVAEADKPTRNQCKDKNANLINANKELKDAQDHYDHLANLAGKPGVSSATTSANLLSSTSAATETDLNIEKDKTLRIKAVANVVKTIVLSSFNQEDETAFFCYRAIKNENGQDTQVKRACLGFITAKVKEHEATVQANTAEILRSAGLQRDYDKTITTITEENKESFEKFWDKIKDGSGKLDKAKLTTIISKNFPNNVNTRLRSKLNKMKQKSTRGEILEIFNTLFQDEIDELLND